MPSDLPWRWDQGRKNYFRVDNLILLSKSLIRLDGVQVGEEDRLREPLERETGLAFLPTHYSVWRNYKRVFEWSLLATGVNGVLRVTQLCRALAAERVSADDYLTHLATCTVSPHPATENYNPATPRSYPLLVCLRAAEALRRLRGDGLDVKLAASLGLHGAVGTEDDAELQRLLGAPLISALPELRQIREMLAFLGQFAGYYFENGKLCYEESLLPHCRDYLRSLNLDQGTRCEDAESEVLRLGSLEMWASGHPPPFPDSGAEYDMDEADHVAEGKRQMIYHSRIERSPAVRRMFLRSDRFANRCCEGCGVCASDRYPWLEHQVEIHHVLPLSHPLRAIGDVETALEDIVGLCPNCHRAIHAYYRAFLRERGLADFDSIGTAKAVFTEALNQIRSQED